MKVARLAKACGAAVATALTLCLAACGQPESASTNASGGSSSGETSFQAENSVPEEEPSGQEAAAASTGNESASTSTVSFGNYPQGDGAPIKWIVLDAGPDKALLLAQDCVDSLPWDEAHSGATWNGCSPRA